MSSLEIFGSSLAIKPGNPEVRVPPNTTKIRAYRNMNYITAVVGVATSIGICALMSSLVYLCIINPTKQNLAMVILGAIFALLLPLLPGLAIWPAMQTTKTLTKMLHENLPALVINEQGIQDNSSNYVFGFLSWDEIDAVSVESRYAPNINKTFAGVAIVVKNKEVLLNKKPPILRMWLKQDNEVVKKRWVFIPQGRVEMPVEEVVRLANQIKAQH